MTENEAIKGLETSIDLVRMCTQNYERKREIQCYEMAINALIAAGVLVVTEDGLKCAEVD